MTANMTEEEKAKHDVIEAVFYDEEKGYVSKINTLKHVKHKINILLRMI